VLKEKTVRRAMEDLGVRVTPIRGMEGSGQITGHTWTLPPRSTPPF
jgi:hypothetical protein